MARLIRSGRSSRLGFTIIELMIVVTIIGILLAVAIPVYTASVTRAKESVLKQNLFTLRIVIDEYTYDKAKAPQSLQDLVREGYLRQIPVDPITGEADWTTVIEDAVTSVSQTEPGIYTVYSKSDKRSLEGTSYNEW